MLTVHQEFLNLSPDSPDLTSPHHLVVVIVIPTPAQVNALYLSEYAPLELSSLADPHWLSEFPYLFSAPTLSSSIIRIERSQSTRVFFLVAGPLALPVLVPGV